MSIYSNSYSGHIRQIRKFCHFTSGSFIKSSCQKSISHFSCICFFKCITDSQISIALCKNCFTFTKVSFIKRALLNKPVFEFSTSHIIFHNLHTLFSFPVFILLLLRLPQMPVPVPERKHTEGFQEEQPQSTLQIISYNHKKMLL